MKNKHVTIFGDSVMNQLFHSFSNLLEINSIPYDSRRIIFETNYESKSIKRVRDDCQYIQAFGNIKSCTRYNRAPRNCTCNYVSQLLVPQFNITVTSVSMYRLQIPDSYLPASLRDDFVADMKSYVSEYSQIYYPLFEHYVSLSDSVIISMGLHYEHTKMKFFAQTLSYVANTLASDMATAGSRKRHAYWLTGPTHFNGPHGGEYFRRYYDQYDVSPPCVRQSSAPHVMNTMAKSLLNGVLPTLDITPMLLGRGDLHNSVYRGDCTHWCFSYELYLPQWAFIARYVNPTASYL
jgi:hypothetical protein